jgi:hypothetical protein
MEASGSVADPQGIEPGEGEPNGKRIGITAEEHPMRDAVDAAADAGEHPEKELSPEDKDLATAWFMEQDPGEVYTQTFEINVGRYDEDKHRWEDFFIPWTVRAIDRDELRRIRRMARPAGPRSRGAQQDGTDDSDDMQANLLIATEATVSPDLTALRGQFANPAVALKFKLSHRPGLIDQIAGRVMSASGYDDADVREITAAETHKGGRGGLLALARLEVR